LTRYAPFRALAVRSPVLVALLLATGCLLNRPAPPPSPAAVESTPASPVNPSGSLTGTGALTQAEQIYVDAIKRQSEPVKASIGRFNEDMANPRPTNAAWKADLNQQIDAWPTFAPQLNAITPPPKFQQFHASYREALLHMGVAATIMKEAQQTGNQALAPEINSRITEANLAFADANRRVPDLVTVARIGQVLPTSLVAR